MKNFDPLQRETSFARRMKRPICLTHKHDYMLYMFSIMFQDLNPYFGRALFPNPGMCTMRSSETRVNLFSNGCTLPRKDPRTMYVTPKHVVLSSVHLQYDMK